MKVYQFTLILPDLDGGTAEAIYAACNDSSLGRTSGTTYLAFDREATSLELAIESALADLKSLGVEPLRIEMDVPYFAA